MKLPDPGDFIDIHTHDGTPQPGNFLLENLMVHENRVPDNTIGLAYSVGVHPWFLTQENSDQQIGSVREYSINNNVLAIGEAGFDRLKGPSLMLQRDVFEAQAGIAEKVSKPLLIHCVRSWDELLSEQKKLDPSTPWIIHGFRGKKELAMQLISKGMYLSFWFDFILRPESTALIQSLPKEKIFLETDGSGVSIESIYKKVAADLQISVEELKAALYSNFKNLFLNKKL